MEHLIDSCVWIDHFRPTTPASIRRVANEAINRASAVLCEPVWFELLRLCAESQRRPLEARLSTLPMLPTPADLWRTATILGQRCRDGGVQAGFSDLLIATICLQQNAVLVTFDRHFEVLGQLLGFETEFFGRKA